MTKYATAIFLISIAFFSMEKVFADGRGLAKESMSHEACVERMQNLDEKFYRILFARSATRNDVDAALIMLRDVKSECNPTRKQQAQIADLKGEAAHLAFQYTEDKEYIKIALASYEQALSLDPARSELVNWHLSQLMRSSGDYEKAIQYINKVLEMEPKPKDPLPYLITAFQLSVDTNQWADAKGLIELLSRKNERFYKDPDVLLSAVKTLCHFNQLDDAKIIIGNVEKHVQLDSRGKQLLEMSKKTAQYCTH